MNHSSLEFAGALCQGLTMLLGFIGYAPMWSELYKAPERAPSNVRPWAIWLFSTLLTLAYSLSLVYLSGSGMMLLITTVSSLFTQGFTIGLIKRAHRRT